MLLTIIFNYGAYTYSEHDPKKGLCYYLALANFYHSTVL